MSALIYAALVAAAIALNTYLGILNFPAPISDCYDEPQAYSQHWFWCGVNNPNLDSISPLKEDTLNEETKPEVEAAPAL